MESLLINLRISSFFVVIFIWAGSPLIRQTLMLRWYLYMKVSLDAIAFKVQNLGSKLVPKTIRDICTYTYINFRIRVTNMLLVSCNACNAISGCDSVSTIFQAIKNKIHELTDMIDFGEFTSLSLEGLSVVTSVNCVNMLSCYLHEENGSGSSVTELRYS